MAQRELDRLKGIVTRFLDFARPQPPRQLTGDPMLLLDSVAKLAAETARMAGVIIRIEDFGHLPAITLDLEQIKQVLRDLSFLGADPTDEPITSGLP